MLSPLFYKKSGPVMLGTLLLLYLFLAAREMNLPGIHDDEAFSACGTIDLLKNKDSNYLAGVTFLGRRFPLMAQAYHATAISYFLLPFFLIFGISVYSLRMASIFFGMLTLVFTYLFCRKAFSESVALIATFLLSVSPYFISVTRVGETYHSYVAFFSISSFYYLFNWYMRGGLSRSLLGAFLLGLGCSTAGWFIAYPAALLLLVFIFRKEIQKRIRKEKIKPVCLVPIWVLFFCFGNFLFIYTNFINKATRFITFKLIFSNFPVRLHDAGSISNLDFIGNLTTRFYNLVQILKENNIMFATGIEVKSNDFYPFVFFAAVSWVTAALIFGKIMEPRERKIIFSLLLLVPFILITASPFGIFGLASSQLLILVPFIQIISALGLTKFSIFLKKGILRNISLVIACACIAISTVINAAILKTYYAGLKRTGGSSSWPGAIYDLASWIKKNNYYKIASFGYTHSLYFLMRGEAHIYGDDTLGSKEKLEGLLNDENVLYVFDTQRKDLEANVAYLYKIAGLMGKTFVKKKSFRYKDGALIGVYSLVPETNYEIGT